MSLCHCGKPLGHLGRHVNPPNPQYPTCTRCGGTTYKTGRRPLSDGWRAQEYRCRVCGYEMVREQMRRVYRLADYERNLRRLLDAGRSHKEIMHELGMSHWGFYKLRRELLAVDARRQAA